MDEYIKRKAAIDLITRRYKNPEICTQEIYSIPAADVVPVVHARWVFGGDGCVICSECNEEESNDNHRNYCPMCFGCGRKFEQGTMMERSCVFDGAPWTCYLCESCQKASSELGWQDEYGFGDLRERALEIESAKMDGKEKLHADDHD